MGKRTKTKDVVLVSSPQEITIPSCDSAKLRDDLAVYMNISGQLRAKRTEMCEVDRCGTLNDKKALEMSMEVAKLKRSSDKLRLSVCDQLRAYIVAIHNYVANQSTDNSKFSLELAEKCNELLHSITITAIKEEILQKKRLLSNIRLHNGKSSVTNKVQVEVRVMVVWFPFPFVRTLQFAPNHSQPKNVMMTPESTQLTDQRGDGFDGVRDKLRTFIKFHDAVGFEMGKVHSERMERHPRDLEAEKVEADQRLMSCLRFIGEVTADGERNVSSHVMMQVLEIVELLDESQARYANLHTRFNNLLAQHDQVHAQRDLLLRLVLIFVAVAIYQFIC